MSFVVLSNLQVADFMKSDVNNPLRIAVIIKNIIGERGVVTCYSIY